MKSFPLSRGDLANLPAAGGLIAPVADDFLRKINAHFQACLPQALSELHCLPLSPCVGGRSCEVLFNAVGALEVLELFPDWPALGFFPVGGDGCGNYFVVQSRLSEPRPVLFVEPISGAGESRFAVASDFDHFLKAVLENRDWFHESSVLRQDPQLGLIKSHALPWEAR